MNIRRTPTILAGFALGTFSMAAMADPFTLQGVCRVTSTIAAQGTCQLQFVLSDDATTTPATIAQSLITVDGIEVSHYLNDIGTPGTFSAGTVSGETAVSCSTTHTVRAYIYRTTTPGVQEKVGLLPAIACPTPQ